MKNILLIANYQQSVGGISVQVEELYSHLREDKQNVEIFSTKGSFLKRIILFFKLIIVARQFDVLHIHGCSRRGMLPIIFGVIAGKLWNKRIIISYHGGEADDFFQKNYNFAFRWLMRADERIVLSGFLKEVFDRYHIPCVVVPNIITMPDKPLRIIGQQNPYRFISVRHLRELYNIPCILRAFAIVKKQIPQATLTILGQGPMRSDLEQRVVQNHIEGVTFTGQVDNNAMTEYLLNADILLSAPHFDNMPVSLLEAMNAGVLVVSSRVGGISYMIEDGMTGLLFTDDNSQELADKMLWAHENPQQVQSIINNAYESVKQYTWENIRSKIYDIYNI